MPFNIVVEELCGNGALMTCCSVKVWAAVEFLRMKQKERARKQAARRRINGESLDAGISDYRDPARAATLRLAPCKI
jgi:hypothetical protein